MAANSSSCKSWSITLVSAIIVVLIDKDKAEYINIGIAPIILFGLLDSYYLTMETLFRNRYNSFIEKLHSNAVGKNDLFVVSPQENVTTRLILKSLKSISIYPFYLVFITIVLVIRLIAA